MNCRPDFLPFSSVEIWKLIGTSWSGDSAQPREEGRGRICAALLVHTQEQLLSADSRKSAFRCGQPSQFWVVVYKEKVMKFKNRKVIARPKTKSRPDGKRAVRKPVSKRPRCGCCGVILTAANNPDFGSWCANCELRFEKF